MNTTIYKDKTVNVLHHGFDIAIIECNGHQSCVRVKETTLYKRKRPDKPKY